MRKYILLIIAFLQPIFLFATHNRAGEIVYQHVSGYTYKITVYTYTYTLSDADRDTLEVQWGDNTKQKVNRIEKIDLPDYYRRNVYVGYHSYPGPGTYQIVMEDPNRNEGVLNIPNSVNVVFAIKTVLQINSIIGANSTPVLLNMPIDKAAINTIFVHNPAAFDPDGDSLSYKLAVCLYEEGKPIPQYSLPPASKSITVDAVTGNLIWETPTIIGKFNLAMEIEEWRQGVKISSIIRDIQIDVVDSDNHAPDIAALPNLCVIADSLVTFNVKATDPDNERVTLTAVGGLFELDISPAQFNQPVSGSPSVTSVFNWQTVCEHIRHQPYTVIFKAEDDNPELKLVDYEDVNIQVIAPAPKITTIDPSNSSVYLVWDRGSCKNPSGYKVYRKNSLDDFIPGICETGLPESTGYQLIAEVTNGSDTSFLDNNNGKGLSQGFLYCYRVVSVFSDGAQSIASKKACVELIRGLPVFTQVSVNYTDTDNGAIFIQWMKPAELDTLTVKPPYKYLLFPARGITGGTYTDPFEIFGLNDTTFLDTLIDTKSKGSIYRLVLANFDSTANDWNTVGSPSYASSVYLNLYNTDKKIVLTTQFDVPWENDTIIFYRENNATLSYDSIGFSLTGAYTDINLLNGVTYCYKAKSIGKYTSEGYPERVINWSQINCGTPVDTVPPLPVNLKVTSICDELRNQLTWILPSNYGDIKEYQILYAPNQNSEPVLIATLSNAQDTVFSHYPTTTLAGCYQIFAIDSTGNVSSGGQKVCVDNCSFYELPNIFTPNADSKNDLFHPLPYQFVEKVDFKLYNRWGNLLFQTTDPDINWDGRETDSGNLVSDGIYYYVCEVFEYRLSGLEGRNLTGFIHVYSTSQNKQP